MITPVDASVVLVVSKGRYKTTTAALLDDGTVLVKVGGWFTPIYASGGTGDSSCAVKALDLPNHKVEAGPHGKLRATRQAGHNEVLQTGPDGRLLPLAAPVRRPALKGKSQ